MNSACKSPILRASAIIRQLPLCTEPFSNAPKIQHAPFNPSAFASAASAQPPAPTEPPVSVRLHRKEKRIELLYEGGTKISLAAELLRVCSPSADTSRLQANGRRVVSGRRHVGILSVEPVGSYALRIHFDDLHSSGIFTWDYLAHLGGPGRWPAMRDYLRRLRQAGLSRDPRPARVRATATAAIAASAATTTTGAAAAGAARIVASVAPAVQPARCQGHARAPIGGDGGDTSADSDLMERRRVMQMQIGGGVAGAAQSLEPGHHPQG